MRVVVYVAASIAGLSVLGCMALGGAPADGGCGGRPDGLIVDDITGVWEGNDTTFTLQLGGIITGTVTLLPPDPSVAGSSPGPSASSSRRPGLPTRPPTTPPTPTPLSFEATGQWALKPETNLGDIDVSTVDTPRGRASFGFGMLFVSGTRTKPFLYVIGGGDPDSCNIIKFARTSRG